MLAPQLFKLLVTLIFAGHWIAGTLTSAMVTVAWQVEVLPTPLAVVRVTVLFPILAQVKLLGATDNGVIAPQASEPPAKTWAGRMLALPETFKFIEKL